MSLGRDYFTDPDPPEPPLTHNSRWLCADGREVRVRDMTDGHLQNVVSWIRRQPATRLKIYPPLLGDTDGGDVEEIPWCHSGHTKKEWLCVLRKEQHLRYLLAVEAVCKERSHD